VPHCSYTAGRHGQVAGYEKRVHDVNESATWEGEIGAGESRATIQTLTVGHAV